jgi:hypothetical protein
MKRYRTYGTITRSGLWFYQDEVPLGLSEVIAR